MAKQRVAEAESGRKGSFEGIWKLLVSTRKNKLAVVRIRGLRGFWASS